MNISKAKTATSFYVGEAVKKRWSGHMKSNQIQFSYRNNLFYMLWEILTDETDEVKIMEYVKTKLFKREPLREEIRRTKSGWMYGVYVE